MAKSSAMPLLLLVGGAAVVMSSKKKKKKKKKEVETPETPEAPETLEVPDWSKMPEAPQWSKLHDPRVQMPEAGGDSEKFVFNAECTEFANNLNYDKHNEYITGMFHDMVEDGVRDAASITRAMLKDQAPNCPWDDQTKWTDLMKGLWTQLYAAVAEYAAQLPGYEPSTGLGQPG